MKTARKLLTLLIAAIMMVAAMSLSASASIADTAKSIESGQTLTTTLYNKGDQADYKITVASAGTLKISLTSEMYYCGICVYDAYGNTVKVSSENVSSTSWSSGSQNGDNYYTAKWNTVTESFIGTINYGVSKGTYYIRLERNSSIGNGKIKFTATYPTTTSKAKITYLSATISKGSTLQMGAVLSPANGGTVTWKSNNTKIATISSTGKVTAKAKGATYICATCGDSKRWFKINVI